MKMFKIIIIHIKTVDTLSAPKNGSISKSLRSCNLLRLTNGTYNKRTEIGTGGIIERG